MKQIAVLAAALFMWLPLLTACRQESGPTSITVPFVLDHNRMLVEAEIQGADSTWHKVRLWVDTGNPEFFISPELAGKLGIDLSEASGNFDVPSPSGVRIGGMMLDFEGVPSQVMFQPFWLFSATHNDANLPATVLKKYQVVFDYPKSQLTLAEPGGVPPKGVRAPGAINPQTGIVQVDAVIAEDSLSFALDNGASYSFVSDDVLASLRQNHADWPQTTGTLGCANMWGWWPANGPDLTVMRLPEIVCGSVSMNDVGMVGVPKFSPDGPTLGQWYSEKAAQPVEGFLGPNAFKNFRVEIDYANNAIYFEKSTESDPHDTDIVGLILRPEEDGGFSVVGVAQKDGKPSVEKVEPGDRLTKIGQLDTRGVTMGTVIDALRGEPGEVRILVFERDGTPFTVTATVMRFL